MVCVWGGGILVVMNIDVFVDILFVVFFMVVVSIIFGVDLLLEYVGINFICIGVINIFKVMGVNLDVSNECEVGGELVVDICV